MLYLDQELANIIIKLPRFSFASAMRQSPSSLAKAKEDFFNNGSIPRFAYPKTLGIDIHQQDIAIDSAHKAIDALGHEKHLTQLYHQLLHERTLRIRAIAAAAKGDDQGVSTATSALFGKPIDAVDELLTQLMRAPAPPRPKASRIVETAEVREVAAKMFAAYEMENAKIVMTNRTSARITRSSTRPIILRLPKTYARSVEETIKFLTHEIEGHALRTMNAYKGPLAILFFGMPGYLPTDEGLALFIEHEKGTMLTPGFWNALAASLTATRTFGETFAILAAAKRERAKKIGDREGERTSNDAAWQLCVRAYRGITYPNQPGLGYFRDHIYRTGYLAVQYHLRQHPEDFHLLFAGHCSLEQLPLLRKLGITASQAPKMLARSLLDR